MILLLSLLFSSFAIYCLVCPAICPTELQCYMPILMIFLGYLGFTYLLGLILAHGSWWFLHDLSIRRILLANDPQLILKPQQLRAEVKEYRKLLLFSAPFAVPLFYLAYFATASNAEARQAAMKSWIEHPPFSSK